jgi:hypothetical protein
MSSSKRKSRTKSSGASRERVYIESFDFISPHGRNKIISQTNKKFTFARKKLLPFRDGYNVKFKSFKSCILEGGIVHADLSTNKLLLIHLLK